MTKKKTMDGIDAWYNYGIDLESRTIYIGTSNFNSDGEEMGLDALMAEHAVKGIHILDSTPGDINIYLNSVGGDWYHGMAIYDMIKNATNPTTIVGVGNVMSMGAVLMQAGTRRVLLPNTTVMIHHGTVDYGGKTYKDAHNWAEFEKRLSRTMAEMFQSRAGKTVAYWTRKCNNDQLYTAQEAVDIGLADEIYTRKPGQSFKGDR